jgi:hypothetical protein
MKKELSDLNIRSGQQPDKGAVRETFAINQLALNHQLSYPETADILVDGSFCLLISRIKKQNLPIHYKATPFVLGCF